MEKWGIVQTGWTNSQVNGLVFFRKQVIITNLVFLIYSHSFEDLEMNIVVIYTKYM